MGKITSETQDATGNSLGFPQLKECRGVELLRCTANCRDLSVISCSWNAKDLRSFLGDGQGKIYLRPIQKSLSTQPLVAQSQCEVKEKCHMCNQEILVRRLRDHLWSCTEGLESEDDEDTSTTNVIPETSNVSTTLTNATLGSPVEEIQDDLPAIAPHSHQVHLHYLHNLVMELKLNVAS